MGRTCHCGIRRAGSNRIIVIADKNQNGDKKAAIKDGDKIKNVKTASQKAPILEYLTDHAFAKCADISAMLGVKSARARQFLGEMVEDGAVSTEGGNRNRIYRLKS